MRRVGLTVLLNVAAVAFYAIIGTQLGFFGHMSDTLFWSPDSHIYRDVANWLYRSGPWTIEAEYRPFLFPLILGGADRVGGAAAIWVVNFGCWLGTVNLTAEGVRRMTGRDLFGVIVFLIIASNISLIVLTFQALTESVNAVLEAAWIFGLAISSIPPARARDFAVLILPLTLMTVVRPGNELLLIVAAVLVVVAIWRTRSAREWAVLAVIASSVPLMIQLALMILANHYFGLSAAGATQFKDYYASQVYASVNGLPADLVAAHQAVRPMSNTRLGIFLLSHPTISGHVFLGNLRANLTAGSNFIDVTRFAGMARAIRLEDKAYAIVDIVFAPIVLISIVLARNLRLILLTVFLAVLVLLCSLINTQGDRYIDMAVPLWASAYAVASSDLLSRVSRRSVRVV